MNEVLLLAARVFQSLTEGAAQRTHSLMQGVAGVVHDEHLCLWSSPFDCLSESRDL